MAEAFLRHFGNGEFEVRSVGLAPQGNLHPLTQKVMEEAGYDMGGYQSKGFHDVLDGTGYTYIITVCEEARQHCPPALMARGRYKLHWGFNDPTRAATEAQKLAAFRKVRDDIERTVQVWLEEMHEQPVYHRRKIS